MPFCTHQGQELALVELVLGLVALELVQVELELLERAQN
jgi:hypothetical protein